MNQKFVRSQSPEWNTHTIAWRNKPEIDTLSLDDLNNNLKIYEPEIGESKQKKFVNEPIVGEPTVKKHVVETSEAKANADKPKAVRKNNGAPIIEDWVFDSEEEDVPQARIQKKTVKPSFAKIEFVKSKEQVKPSRKTTVKQGQKVVVNAAKPKAVLNGVKGNQVNAVKASACWEKGVIDSGCSRHMTGNMSYLTDFEEIDGGYVAFGGNPKGGKITGRGTIKTGNLDFENLTDESHVLLKIPRKNNMYSVDLKNIVPKGGLSCLFAKSISEGAWSAWVGGGEMCCVDAVSYLCSIVCCECLVLVTKPHNKTPYELFLGRKPALGFMRPFGCLVIILNTIDHLGKFDGKADEGFFVGYSINNNSPNIARNGPNWLFDIDALTKSMNYKPVVAGNQSNGNPCTKACDDAGKARMETVPGKDYILLPLWTVDPLFSQSSKSSPDVGFKPLGDDEKKVTEEPRKEGGDPSKEGESNEKEKEDNVNRTNTVNTVSTNKVNAIDDDEDVGAEADMKNLDAFIPISLIPTVRVHKDHTVEQIIGDLNSASQTRRTTKNLEKEKNMVMTARHTYGISKLLPQDEDGEEVDVTFI
ncbi:ribonuclease H-like domain-containing protein [Tanacetum coccineum]